MKLFRNALFFAVVIASIGILIRINANAIAISPPLGDYTIAPGSIINEKFITYNNEERSDIYEFIPVNVDYIGETSKPVYNLLEAPEKDTLASWIRVEPIIHAMDAKSSVEASFSIEVPKDARPGTHTAIIFVLSSAELKDIRSGAQVGIGRQIGMTIILNVEGEVTQEPKLAEFKLNNGFNFFGYKIMNMLPADFETRLSNSGNTYYIPQGTIVIRDSKRENVKTNLNLNPNNHRVFPGNTRLYTNHYIIDENSLNKYQNTDSTSIKGKLKKIINYIHYSAYNLTFGKYNAELSVDSRVNQEKQIVFGEQINFIVFPYKPIFFTILLITLYYTQKRWRKKFLNKKN